MSAHPNQAYCNSTSAAGALAPSTPANSALGTLGGSISNLQERLSILKDKLGPVLLPPRPTAEPKDREGSPIPLVDEIHRQTDRVDDLVVNVIDLIERLGV